MRTFKTKPENVVKVLTYSAFFITQVSLFGYSQMEFLILSTSIALLSIYLDIKKIHPPRFILNLSSLTVIFFALWSVNVENVVDQGMKALLILVGIKFLEQKRFRDYLQIYVLILILSASRALISLNVSFLFYILTIFLLLSVSVVYLTFYKEVPESLLSIREVKKIFFSSLLIFFFSILASFVIFFFLPRTEYPVFQFLNKQHRAKTGINEYVSLGTYNEIEEDETVVFRAKTEKIEEPVLYWRACVLDHFDGERWSRRRKTYAQNLNYQGGRLIKQTIFIDVERPPYLFALDRPVHFSFEKVKGFDDHSFILLDFRGKKLRYEVLSELTDVIREKNIDRNQYLQVPHNVSNEVKKIVEGITRDTNDDLEKVIRIYDFLAKGDYVYSLEGLPVGKDALEKFLLETKKGHCEFFASAFAIMLRIAQIPSRMVVGFRGGEYNGVGKYYIVRQKNAHVWVEAYLQGSGWIRYDPTPPKAQNGQTEEPRTVSSRIFLFLDILNYYWTLFIVNYDLEKQISFINSMSFGIREKGLSLKFSGKGAGFIALAILFFGIGIMCILKVSAILRLPTERRILIAFLRKLEKMGYKRQKGEGLEELVKRVKEERLREKAYVFVREIEQIVYKDRELSGEKKQELKRLLRNLK